MTTEASIPFTLHKTHVSCYLSLIYVVGFSDKRNHVIFKLTWLIISLNVTVSRASIFLQMTKSILLDGRGLLCCVPIHL